MLVASDGIYDIPHPHPRGYGCFARVIRRFVRELGVLSLEKAVFKMSGFPAQRFGLRDRGHIAEGMAADLVLFDSEQITDRSTWKEPLRRAVGVELVMVNGKIAFQNGTPTGCLPGRVLCRAT
jgi:N-acyl-D-aspartate/D-glutamate deacylase